MKRHINVIAPSILNFLGLFSSLGREGIGNITLSPFIISRKPMTNNSERHEIIHIHQQQECSLVASLILLPAFLVIGPWAAALTIALMWLPFVGPFYCLYGVYYIWGLIKYRQSWCDIEIKEWPSPRNLGTFAYWHIPFEQEAYYFEGDESALRTRKAFRWLRFHV